MELSPGMKLPSPWYLALILCMPGVRFVTTRLAVPPAAATCPSTLEPSKNTTFPVGVPYCELNVALRVTGELTSADELLLVTTTVAGYSTAAIELLVMKLPSPSYRADTLWTLCDKVVTTRLAVPLVATACPSKAVPSKNATLPLGVPSGEFTVAVKVTDGAVSVDEG